jgi:hypothetical protein
MTVMHGPAHPDMFRVQVGRYGDRFYVDRLPADELGEPMDDPVPSVSVVKSAYPKFLGTWISKVTAEYAYDNRDVWARLEREDAVDLIQKASNRFKNKAADRGTDIHKYIDSLALGQHVNEALLPDTVLPFTYAAKRMVSELKLSPIYIECVGFERTYGYGGTVDFIGDTIFGRGLIDFKTRENYNKYDEEAAQVAAYAAFDYIIVEDESGVRRVEPPEYDFVAIVVLTPQGYQVHQINFAASFRMWTSLVDFWRAKSQNLWHGIMPVPNKVDASALEHELRMRIQAMPSEAREHLAKMWPMGVPTFKQGVEPHHLVPIERAVVAIEARFSLAFHDSVPVSGVSTTWDDLVACYESLTDGERERVMYVMRKAPGDIRRFSRTVNLEGVYRNAVDMAKATTTTLEMSTRWEKA